MVFITVISSIVRDINNNKISTKNNQTKNKYSSYRVKNTLG